MDNFASYWLLIFEQRQLVFVKPELKMTKDYCKWAPKQRMAVGEHPLENVHPEAPHVVIT